METREDYSMYLPILLQRKEQKRRRRRNALDLEIEWMLQMTASSLFTPLPPSHKAAPLDHQNYTRWKITFQSNKLAHPRRARRRAIVIQPLSYTSPDYSMAQVESLLLESLSQFCSVYFVGMNVVLSEPAIELSGVRRITSRVHQTTQREQLLVGDVTRYMRSNVTVKSFCTVGITLVDLYPSPKWNFTLGHASFADGLAVCSFGRHFNTKINEFQTGGTDLWRQMRNMWILIRVISHEIGHLFGLTHCHYFYCSMNESTTIEEAVTQPLFLCPICLRKLHKVLKFDIRERYSQLREECTRILHLVEEVLKNESDTESRTSGRPEIKVDIEVSGTTFKSQSNPEMPSDDIEGDFDASISDPDRDCVMQCDTDQVTDKQDDVTHYFRKAIDWLDQCLASFNTC